jgi:hypothetical protein
MRKSWIVLAALLPGCADILGARYDDLRPHPDGGTGDASRQQRCVQPAHYDRPLIDDFEDDLILLTGDNGDHRFDVQARARLYDDGSGSTYPAEGDLQRTNLDPPRNGSYFGVRITGQNHTSWGASLSIETEFECYDASGYDGIKFWAKGSGGVWLHANALSNISVDTTGTCVTNCGLCFENCGGHSSATHALSAEWTLYSVRWTELEQLLPESIPFDPSTIVTVTLETAPPVAEGLPWNFDLWLDDISFMQKQPSSAGDAGPGG